MSKPVLFATGLGKEIERAENLCVLYDAYKGEKKLVTMHDVNYLKELRSGVYGLLVTDIFPKYTPLPCIMVWHAIQGGKYIGLKDKRTYYRTDYAHYMNYVISASSGAVEMWHSTTDLPYDRILNLGMARTDRYIGKKKGDGHTILAKKRSYLYVPTFRSPYETPFPMIDWEYIDHELKDDELLVVKSHPVTKTFEMSHYKHIMEVNGMESSVNYLYDCDVVITDYSSIMFDGYLLNKPCVLFEKNPGYTETRGMYMKYPDEYSSRYATDEYDLLRLIRSAEFLTETELKCRDKVADACDGHSCERICELIERMNNLPC